MSVDESADAAAKLLDSQYLSGFLDHITAAQDHLEGNDGTPLFPSFLSPNTVWTAREKEAFFHALSVYSRLRPDLISHEIKTKSVHDVCNYLTILQVAASRQEPTDPYSQWRQNLPIATEVSSEWVAMEEEKAAELITQEQDWQRELTAKQRRAKIKLLKRASRAEPHDVGPSQCKAALKQQIADADRRARGEDFCGSLGYPELTAIDTILREASDFSGSKKNKPVLHTPTLQHSVGHVPRLEGTQTLPFSTTNGAHDIPDVSVIVQLTCGISVPFFTVAAMENHINGGSDEGPPPPHRPEPPPTSPLEEDSVEALSPASRRRCKKRLYMRRKRASVSGVTVIDDSLERLKPGRKKVKRSPPLDDESQCELEYVEDKGGKSSACEDDGPSMPQKRYPRAKKMALDELRDLGLGANELRRLGVGVLNPEGVAKMLRYVVYYLTPPTNP